MATFFEEERQMGKRSVGIGVLVTALLLTFGACTKHDFPSCTDDNVKKLVLEKSYEITKDLYLAHATPTKFGLKEAKGAYELLKERMGKKDEPNRDEIRKLLSSADKVVENMTVDLSDVKQTDRHKKSGTTVCTGALTFINKETKKQGTAHVEYTAQFVEGHKLKVELTRF
jgi:hypothetical protein